jgi:hypothetical protein
MAYSASAPAICMVARVGAGPAWWHYQSADIHTDVDASDYFTNGHALGMKVNDVVIVVKTTATIGATVHVVTAVTAGGAATVAPAILA